MCESLPLCALAGLVNWLVADWATLLQPTGRSRQAHPESGRQRRRGAVLLGLLLGLGFRSTHGAVLGRKARARRVPDIAGRSGGGGSGPRRRSRCCCCRRHRCCCWAWGGCKQADRGRGAQAAAWRDPEPSCRSPCRRRRRHAPRDTWRPADVRLLSSSSRRRRGRPFGWRWFGAGEGHLGSRALGSGRAGHGRW